jgi:hypothetical protein
MDDSGSEERDPASQLRQLIPLHAACDTRGLRVIRSPGRPPRARVAPDHDQRGYRGRISELQDQFVDADPIVVATTKGRDELDQVLRGLAEEIASLRFERQHLDPTSRETPIVTSRIVDGLTKLATVTIIRARCNSGTIDPHGPEMQTMAKMFVERVTKVARETMAPELAEQFLRILQERMHGWQDRAAELL